MVCYLKKQVNFNIFKGNNLKNQIKFENSEKKFLFEINPTPKSEIYFALVPPTNCKVIRVKLYVYLHIMIAFFTKNLNIARIINVFYYLRHFSDMNSVESLLLFAAYLGDKVEAW